MKMLVVASVCTVLCGYVISEVVSYTDPAMNDVLAGITYEEMNRNIRSLDVAGGEDDLTFSEEVAVQESTETSLAGLSDEDVDRIARRVIELMSDQTVREISWDVIPDLAEIVIKGRIPALENPVD